ncbi:phosphopantetheine-binding protein [Streptomyces sp. NPDC001939]|nr:MULTISPECIES: phosphopantetheine-binding protein [Streptomyces]MCX5085801.1 phosphopantetheine-binding protein [Streptomyces sp. NBC_00401]UDM03101.1 phosphopantetheine-binding protein [Streptomyces longhuiensis]
MSSSSPTPLASPSTRVASASRARAAVAAVLTEKFEVGADSIRPDATLASLDLDSLALAELALALQDRLGVRVDESEATKRTTVAELTATLATRQITAGVR